MFKLILITIILVGLAFIGFGVQIFFSKKKSFPSTHISENENMKKLNIKCVKTVDNSETVKTNSCATECSSCCSVH